MRQEALLAFMLDSESGGREFVDVLLVDPGLEPIHRHLFLSDTFRLISGAYQSILGWPASSPRVPSS
jgi:hypothetical protein